MSAHPNWGLRCKGKKKIAYAQGICDFFGVKCKDRQQSCSLEDARYTRYSLEFKGKDTRILFGTMDIERMEYPTTSWDNRRIYA